MKWSSIADAPSREKQIAARATFLPPWGRVMVGGMFLAHIMWVCYMQNSEVKTPWQSKKVMITHCWIHVVCSFLQCEWFISKYVLEHSFRYSSWVVRIIDFHLQLTWFGIYNSAAERRYIHLGDGKRRFSPATKRISCFRALQRNLLYPFVPYLILILKLKTRRVEIEQTSHSYLRGLRGVVSAAHWNWFGDDKSDTSGSQIHHALGSFMVCW